MDENVRSLGQTYGEFMDSNFKECEIDSDSDSGIGLGPGSGSGSGLGSGSGSLPPIQSGVNTHGIASAVNARV